MVSNCPLALDAARGGVEAATAHLLNGFAKTQARVCVLSFRRGVASEHSVQYSPRIKIRYVPLRPARSTKLALLLNGRAVLQRVRARENPDLVHIQGSGTQLLLLPGLPSATTVITPHAILREEARYQTTPRRMLEKRMSAWLDDFAMRRAKNIVHISDYSRRIIASRRGERWHEALINNAVHADFFTDTVPRHDTNRLLFVGALTRRKNVQALLLAVQSLSQRGKHYQCDIVGDFSDRPYRQEVERLVDNLKLPQVVFHGWQDRSAVRELMAQGSVFVLPSKQETLPVSVAEAMAAGMVTVATGVGGVPEMIAHDESGFICDARTPTSLTEILAALHGAHDRKVQIGERARQVARERYHPLKVAEQTLQFYATVLSGDRNRPDEL